MTGIVILEDGWDSCKMSFGLSSSSVQFQSGISLRSVVLISIKYECGARVGLKARVLIM